jgi:hypothetical protein
LKFKFFSVAMALVLALSLCLVMAVPAGADDFVGTMELGTQGNGQSAWSHATYHSSNTAAKLTLPAGFNTSDFGHVGLYPASPTTLNYITSVSYWYRPAGYQVDCSSSPTFYMKPGDPNGLAYPASYVVFDLDTNGDDTADVWVVEYEAFDTTQAWQQDTIDDSNGHFHVEGYTNAYNQSNAGTLAQVKAIDDPPSGTVGTLGNAKVIRVGIETGGWGPWSGYASNDLVTYVDDLNVNGTLYDFESTGSVGLTAEVPDIVAISVTPTNIDFGTLLPGETSDVKNIIVYNVGTHTVDIDAEVDGAALFENNLQLKNYTTGTPDWAYAVESSGHYDYSGPMIDDLGMTLSETLRTKLIVPSGYTPSGTETATLIFTASPVP